MSKLAIIIIVIIILVGFGYWGYQIFLNLEPSVKESRLGEKEEESMPVFEDFSVSEIFRKEPAPVDYSSHPSAETFYTRITERAGQEPNFAGHYTIIEWGCGTSCQTGVIFDAETGKIYNIPGSELGKEYRIDSSLLIVNPDLEEIYRETPGLIFEGISTRYYKWENNTFELIKEKEFKK